MKAKWPTCTRCTEGVWIFKRPVPLDVFAKDERGAYGFKCRKCRRVYVITEGAWRA